MRVVYFILSKVYTHEGGTIFHTEQGLYSCGIIFHTEQGLYS